MNTIASEEGRRPGPCKDTAPLDVSNVTARSDDENDGPVQVTRLPIIIREDDCCETDDNDIEHRPMQQARCKETHFHTSIIRDSIRSQKRTNKVNDDERHEENPHLEDFLIPLRRGGGGADPTNPGECADDQDVDTSQESAVKVPGDKICSTRGILCTGKAKAKPRREVQMDKPHISFEEFKANYVSNAESEPQEEGVKPKCRVHFGDVVVRDYDMTLGDHPSCSYGPPVTLDWHYLEYEPLDINEYEFHRPPRKNMREMNLNYYQRRRILHRAGFTDVDFLVTRKEVNRSKLNRSITRQKVAYFPLSKAEMAVESVCRKFKRLIRDDHWKQQKSLYVKCT